MDLAIWRHVGLLLTSRPSLPTSPLASPSSSTIASSPDLSCPHLRRAQQRRSQHWVSGQGKIDLAYLLIKKIKTIFTIFNIADSDKITISELNFIAASATPAKRRTLSRPDSPPLPRRDLL
ncbi:hypothetical protein CF326_g5517 [Tilletia indica]|nr:hypothetical protein CF326_g5517 [Tilletia indica]